jgi:hypothetical protein
MLKRGLDDKGPVIIEVPMPEKDNPWQFILLPPVRPAQD